MTYSWVTEVFGYTGGIVLSICTIPQIIQIFKTKCAKDISIWFAVLYSLGLSLTFVYMVLIGALAGIITMAFETILSFVVIGSKLYFDRIEQHNQILDKKVIVECADDSTAV